MSLSVGLRASRRMAFLYPCLAPVGGGSGRRSPEQRNLAQRAAGSVSVGAAFFRSLGVFPFLPLSRPCLRWVLTAGYFEES